MKKVLILIYSLLIGAVLGLAGYQIFIAKNFDTNNIAKIGIILVGLIISMIRVFPRSNQGKHLTRKVYKEAYIDLIGTAFSEEPKLEKQLYRAIDDFQASRYDKALKKLEALAAQSSRSADRFAVNVFMALCFDSTKNYRQAIPLYTAALQIRENSTVASNLGLCYNRVGNDEAAIESYLRAHRADSENPYPLNNLAQLLIRHGEYEAALSYTQEALERNDKMVQALNAVAVCHAMMGNTEEYDRAFRRAVSCGSDGKALKEYINALNSEL